MIINEKESYKGNQQKKKDKFTENKLQKVNCYRTEHPFQ